MPISFNPNMFSSVPNAVLVASAFRLHINGSINTVIYIVASKFHCSMIYFQMKWLALCVLVIVVISLAVADGEIWEEDDHEVLIRSERGAKNRGKRIQYPHITYNTYLHSIAYHSPHTSSIITEFVAYIFHYSIYSCNLVKCHAVSVRDEL